MKINRLKSTEWSIIENCYDREPNLSLANYQVFQLLTNKRTYSKTHRKNQATPHSRSLIRKSLFLHIRPTTNYFSETHILQELLTPSPSQRHIHDHAYLCINSELELQVPPTRVYNLFMHQNNGGVVCLKSFSFFIAC